MTKRFPIRFRQPFVCWLGVLLLSSGIRGIAAPDGGAPVGVNEPKRITGFLHRRVLVTEPQNEMRVEFVLRTDGRRWLLAAGRDGFRCRGAREYSFDGTVYRQVTYANQELSDLEDPNPQMIQVGATVEEGRLPPTDHHFAILIWYAGLGVRLPAEAVPADIGCLLMGVPTQAHPCRYVLRSARTPLSSGQQPATLEVSGGGWTYMMSPEGYIQNPKTTDESFVDIQIDVQYGRWGDVPERVRFTHCSAFSVVGAKEVAGPIGVTEVTILSVEAEPAQLDYRPELVGRTLVVDSLRGVEYLTSAVWVEPGTPAMDTVRRSGGKIDLDRAAVDWSGSTQTAERGATRWVVWLGLLSIAAGGVIFLFLKRRA